MSKRVALDDAMREPAAPDLLSELLTARQVAELLQIPRSTVEDYGRRGKLPSIKLGKHRRYARSAVIEALSRLNGHAGTS